MQQRTLARHRTGGTGGWAHPYATGPFSPFLYADGGDGDDSESTDDDTGGDGDADDKEDDAGDSDDDQGDADDAAAKDDKPKPKPPARKPKDGDPAATIADLQKKLKLANSESAKARTDAKKQAADEARTEIVQELGKALGLIKEDDKTPPDPAKLTAQIESAQAAHRETAIELAVFKGASKHNADPGSLTDSRAFMAKLGKLDPSEDGFAKKVSEAIKAAVADNPKLKTGPGTPARTGGDFNGSTGETGGADSIDEIRAARRKRRAG